MIRSLAPRALLVSALLVPQSLSPVLAAGARPADFAREFRVSSTTFENDATVPQSMVFNGTAGNVCTGGDQSPELHWTEPVFGAKSFAVMTFDVTASFTHWGMYNISPERHSLPAGAGMAGSSYGEQIENDFGDFQYDGPCPPPGLVHVYQFTVYALDTKLDLGGTTDFPSTGAALLHAMIGHVIAKATITGLYSTQAMSGE
jgi:hypothetical protein